MNMTKENNTFLKQLLFVFLFSMVLVYYELVFKIFTVGNIFSLGTLVTVLFSIAYGGIGYLLASISKNRKVNRIVSACLILLTSVIYIIQFLENKYFENYPHNYQHIHMFKMLIFQHILYKVFRIYTFYPVIIHILYIVINIFYVFLLIFIYF